MEFTVIPYKFGEKPEVTLPNPAFLTLLTENGMRKMVSDHYDLLRQSTIKHLFPSDDNLLEKAKQHSADFFIQICDGPKYFNENRGKPMLFNRHAPFTITPEARLVWLDCYKEVLSKLDLPEDIIFSFWNYIDKFSIWMINKHPQYTNMSIDPLAH